MAKEMSIDRIIESWREEVRMSEEHARDLENGMRHAIRYALRQSRLSPDEGALWAQISSILATALLGGPPTPQDYARIEADNA